MEFGPNCYRIGNKTYQGRRNGFQSGGRHVTLESIFGHHVRRQEKILNSRRSAMAKTAF